MAQFAVRHDSSQRYPTSAIVSDMRRAVRFVGQHAAGFPAPTPTALACMAAAPAGRSRCSVRQPTPGDPWASHAVLRNPVPSRKIPANVRSARVRCR